MCSREFLSFLPFEETRECHTVDGEIDKKNRIFLSKNCFLQIFIGHILSICIGIQIRGSLFLRNKKTKLFILIFLQIWQLFFFKVVLFRISFLFEPFEILTFQALRHQMRIGGQSHQYPSPSLVQLSIVGSAKLYSSSMVSIIKTSCCVVVTFVLPSWSLELMPFGLLAWEWGWVSLIVWDHMERHLYHRIVRILLHQPCTIIHHELLFGRKSKRSNIYGKLFLVIYKEFLFFPPS